MGVKLGCQHRATVSYLKLHEVELKAYGETKVARRLFCHAQLMKFSRTSQQIVVALFNHTYAWCHEIKRNPTISEISDRVPRNCPVTGLWYDFTCYTLSCTYCGLMTAYDIIDFGQLGQVMVCRRFGGNPLLTSTLFFFSFEALGINFDEISIEMQIFSFKKWQLKIKYRLQMAAMLLRPQYVLSHWHPVKLTGWCVHMLMCDAQDKKTHMILCIEVCPNDFRKTDV